MSGMRKRIVAITIFLATLLMAVGAAEESTGDLWSKFQQTRQSERTLHQVFDVTQQEAAGAVYRQALWRYQISVDLSQGKWRQQFVGVEGNRTEIFDGQDLSFLFKGETDYVRKKGDKKDPQLPEPYDNKLDWSKAKAVQQLPCGFAQNDHTCVIVEAPMKAWIRPGLPGEVTKMLDGKARVMIDPETGVWLRAHVLAMIDQGNGLSVQRETSYTARELNYSALADPTLFKLPEGMHEVGSFKPWDAVRIRKELGGKPAPELQLTDLQGKTVSLADLRGKTVLLDFWATWCQPCVADGPSIDALHRKFGGKNLQIVGISVGEDRDTVEKFLQKHPHQFPIVLSSDNLMPNVYQINIIPTYMVIGADGTLVTVEQGDRGFGELRKALEKSGMSAE